MIVDVECEDGSIQIARTILENTDSYLVQFLEKNKDNFYNFIEQGDEISKDSISGFYDVEKLEETDLYMKISDQGYTLIDDSDDEDFECSTSDDEDTDDDVSLVDEEEA